MISIIVTDFCSKVQNLVGRMEQLVLTEQVAMYAATHLLTGTQRRLQLAVSYDTDFFLPELIYSHRLRTLLGIRDLLP